MHKHQHCCDVQDYAGKSKAYCSVSSGGKEEDELSQTSSLSTEIGRATSSNVDGVLLQDLVDIVPLVESLMDQRPKSSFNRRASVIYTKTPSKEIDSKKITDPKGMKKAAQSVPSKKHRDCLCGDHDKNKGKNAKSYELPTCNSRASTKVNSREEFIKLQERVEQLQRKLSEKDELLKSAQVSMKQMAALNADVSKMKKQVTGKDSLIESTHLKLSDTQVKLVKKQATLECLELEAKTSNRKVEMLQEDLDSMQREISAFTLFLEVLKEDNSTPHVVSDTFPELDQLPYIDDIDETEMVQMEEVREAYVAAVSTAKENQDEESVVLAAKMRLRLQSLVLGPKRASSNERIHSFSALPLDMIVS
ncbi:hypothetical protein MKW94_009530 [Papaver nudicaule]|uniref:Uncharacterized protein n=1 Tax=Papaver nudicaule TaxID=74823 RepID=A0AA41SGX5_PAPNU|nr:hypothetical protein [Papaver nudicaule]